MFPVKEWLRFLASVGKQRVREAHDAAAGAVAAERCAAEVTDAGAKRMIQNYGAVLAAWQLLGEFIGEPIDSGAFLRDLATEMNTHIGETKATRQPWVSIVEKLLSEIAARNFRHPFKFDTDDGVDVLFVRTGHVMAHIQQSNSLRDFNDELTIKSDRVLKQQLVAAGVVDVERGRQGSAALRKDRARPTRGPHGGAARRPPERVRAAPVDPDRARSGRRGRHVFDEQRYPAATRSDHGLDARADLAHCVDNAEALRAAGKRLPHPA